MSTPKERHYQQLAAKLQTFAAELDNTRVQFGDLAQHLQAMNRLGAVQAAQFMAVSRLLDAEMASMERTGDGSADQSQSVDKSRDKSTESP